jgi:hypothetical protein
MITIKTKCHMSRVKLKYEVLLVGGQLKKHFQMLLYSIIERSLRIQITWCSSSLAKMRKMNSELDNALNIIISWFETSGNIHRNPHQQTRHILIQLNLSNPSPACMCIRVKGTAVLSLKIDLVMFRYLIT